MILIILAIIVVGRIGSLIVLQRIKKASENKDVDEDNIDEGLG